ncbi:MAG TPA: hypothetical protein VG759_18175 [Candidatus Angelobacter sp.]|jgi:hypothetical protein|nr:hypothetical protein [Candidatus Angelobacter sp.]
MKNCSVCLVLSAVLLIGATEAAAVHSPTDNNPAPPKLEHGTCLVVELSKSLNAKKLQPGDKVTAKVIQAVVVNGKVVLPRGSKLIGNVTETKARSKEDPESRLGVIFAKALPKNGAEISLDAVVQALGPAQRSRVDQPETMLPPQIGPDNSNGIPQPMGAGRNGATGNSRGSYNAPQTQPVSVAMAPRVSAGTIPNQKEGLQENGMLSSGSRGIFSLPGLNLKFTGASQIPVITSIRDDVKLDSGVQMVLRVVR